jgi:hypothetical protein
VRSAFDALELDNRALVFSRLSASGRTKLLRLEPICKKDNPAFRAFALLIVCTRGPSRRSLAGVGTE